MTPRAGREAKAQSVINSQLQCLMQSQGVLLRQELQIGWWNLHF